MNTNSKPAVVLPVNSYKAIPVLCYHHVDKTPAKVNELRISELQFDQQMKALYDSGFHTILPSQLYDHFTTGSSLPVKPVMITFDDSHEGHYSVAAPILEKYGFRGVFFIMTVCINKKNYLTDQQINTLSQGGHTIACHTYDHLSVNRIGVGQWEQQLDKPIKKLETITGKPVTCFAYPYGIWNELAITELKKRSIKMAFQLTGKHSLQNPLYTIERMLVSGSWSGKYLLQQIAGKFK